MNDEPMVCMECGCEITSDYDFETKYLPGPAGLTPFYTCHRCIRKRMTPTQSWRPGKTEKETPNDGS